MSAKYNGLGICNLATLLAYQTCSKSEEEPLIVKSAFANDPDKTQIKVVRVVLFTGRYASTTTVADSTIRRS